MPRPEGLHRLDAALTLQLGRGFGRFTMGLLWAQTACLAALLGASSPDNSEFGAFFRGEISASVLDYELFRHPNTIGRGHLGMLLAPEIDIRTSDAIALRIGAVVRLPMAIDFHEQFGAAPILALRVRALSNPELTLTFGSLDVGHGFHPALVDEARARYALDLEEAYNHSLPKDKPRDLGGDPFMPTAHGTALTLNADPFSLAGFLDWQFLETPAHREKFVFGTLASLDLSWLCFGGQLRVTHYGGERETSQDNLRATQVDATRNFVSLAATTQVHPFTADWIRTAAFAAWLSGRGAQGHALPSSWFVGLEVGAEVELFGHATLGYRLWLPKDRAAGFLSEDGDPGYREGPAHRARIALHQTIDNVGLSARLDLLVPIDVRELHYLTVTEVRWVWEHAVFGDGS